MKRAELGRFRDEPAPDLWPEIERRLEEPSPAGVTVVRRRRMPVTALAVLLMVGGLAWGLLALTRAIRSPMRPVAERGIITRIPLSGPPQPMAAGYGAAWTVVGYTAGEEFVVRIDDATGEEKELPGTKGAQWIAVGEGAVWVTVCPTGMHPCGGAAVLKLDPASGKVVARISVPNVGEGIVVGLGSVWTSSGEELLRIDPRTNQIVARLPAAIGLWAAAYGTIWGAENKDVIRLDPDTGAVLARIPTPQNVCVLAAGDEGVWMISCSAFNGDQLVRIDPTTNSVVWSTPITGAPMLATGAGFLWLSSSPPDSDSILVRRLDPRTDQFVGDALNVPPTSNRFFHTGYLVGSGGRSSFLAVGQDVLWLSDVIDGEVIRIQLPLG